MKYHEALLLGTFARLCCCLLICWTTSGYAQPEWPRPWLEAPDPPLRLFLIDLRVPWEPMRLGIGSVAAERQGVPNNDPLAHLAGQGLDVSALQDGYSNWISLASSLDVMNSSLDMMALLTAPPAQVWVYEIQPGANSYGVYWALNDYLLRNDVNLALPRVGAAYALFTNLPDAGQWMTLGRVEASDILAATRWRFNGAIQRYEDSGLNVRNTRFVPRIAARQEANPIDLYAPLDHAAPGPPRISEQELAAGAAARGTLLDVLPPTLSCATPPLDASSRVAASATAWAACRPHSKPYREPSQARPSKLVVSAPGGAACLGPQVRDGYIGLALFPCGAGASLFEYDRYRRLNILWQGSFWCLSASGMASDSDTVRFEPCALNDPAQAWVLRNGSLRTYPRGLALQASGGRLQLTSDIHEALLLQPARMARGFFAEASPARSLRVELELGWDWDGMTYYSSPWSSSGWDRVYRSRSYYDYRRQTLSYVQLASVVAVSQRAPRHNCLRSRQHGAQEVSWDWIAWQECDDTGPLSPDLRWDFLSRSDALRFPWHVIWRDLARDPLWVVATGIYPGAYFTALDLRLDYSASSTRHFRIRSDAIRLGPRFAPES